MSKTILVTGATDGIGLLTAKLMAERGHRLLIHGRNASKLEAAARDIGGDTHTYQADLSSLEETADLAKSIKTENDHLDVLINNAGVFKTAEPRLPSGYDTRFIVNTVAPYLLTTALLPIIPSNGRILNLSSAAQATVNISAMKGAVPLGDMDAYAQSKLAITIWSQDLAERHPDGPVVLAVNPGYLLGSKMVKDGFGVPGNDLRIGADILCELALDRSLEGDTGKYWDNEAGQFAAPHPAAAQRRHISDVLATLHEILRAQP